MKFIVSICTVLIFALFFVLSTRWADKKTESNSSRINSHNKQEKREPERGIKSKEGLDNDWFMAQRSYPQGDIPRNALVRARTAMRRNFAKRRMNLTSDWTLAGPSNIGGRITCLLIHPTDPNTIIAGSASGGIWKTTDLGSTWSNIFNESFSIGSLAFDPSNPDIVYTGTGEANPAGVATYPGNGVWKSTDGGSTWVNKGLELTGHIGKIEIHPESTNVLYAAALGLYRGETQERGVYKSTNGGDSWSRILYIDDSTGATDIVINPSNQTILAAMWVRYRTPAISILSGVTSGLYVSSNAGATWQLVTSGFPSNTPQLGRIALAVSPSHPNNVYALAASDAGWGGVYKSTDFGQSWAITMSGSGEGQVWYNNIINVHPSNPAVVWAGMTYRYQSTDGGATFTDDLPSGVHVDQHAMAFAPSDPSIVVLGNDGGIYISTNGGTSFTKSLNLPITQFYAGTINYQNETDLLGGTQDNGSMRGLSLIHDSWNEFYGGDGFYCLVDHTNPNYVYAEYQNGGLGYSTNGGASFSGGTNGIDDNDRKNWETPIAMSWQNPKTLFTGTHRVYRTRNNMQSWTAISPDLTYGNGGRVGTISTIDVATADSNVIYVGTDDGRVWNTIDGGITWTEIDSTLPKRWVTRVTADPVSPNIAYVTFSGFIEYDFGGHVYRTMNYGETWTDIGTSLPDIPVNDIVVDSLNTNNLFIATDLNVMWTNDLGATWQILGNSLPEVSVHDLTFHNPSRTLAAFTHGRSAWTIQIPLDLTSIGVHVSNRWNLISVPLQTSESSVHALFPSAISGAFGFTTLGYEKATELQPGRGYWLKFNSTETVGLSGTYVTQDSILLEQGWNLIGSISYPVHLNSVTTNPPGIITTPLFRFENGYKIDSIITPGKGYWIKTNEAGIMYLEGGSLK